MTNEEQLLENFINNKTITIDESLLNLNDYQRGWLDGWNTCKQIFQAINNYTVKTFTATNTGGQEKG